MMCKVALERRMGFLNTNGHMSNDMIKIMSALKGKYIGTYLENQSLFTFGLFIFLSFYLSFYFILNNVNKQLTAEVVA